MNREAQRGYVVWVVLLVLAVAVIGAWRYSEHRSRERVAAQQAQEAAAKRAQQARIDEERKALEQRKAQEQAQKDALASSLKAMDTLVARWDDAVKVASTTGRIALSGPVATLQAIKRETEGFTVPPCLDAGKAGLLRSMSSTEKGFLTFMRNELNIGSTLAQSDFDDAAAAMEIYKRGRAGCPA
ncbi:hypothetical protein FRC97_19130 [Paracidovorax citrulli]|uniref:hypothetical protein n=1 Tax=Paracidovorax citrulli TaxID=80869 RepID=UPI000662582F|nr:hypothetical protein [Paracidovorax citrulli]UMT96926.1 hypothetical protein FRC97_19130 [Paracidovorax citrulli]